MQSVGVSRSVSWGNIGLMAFLLLTAWERARRPCLPAAKAPNEWDPRQALVAPVMSNVPPGPSLSEVGEGLMKHATACCEKAVALRRRGVSEVIAEMARRSWTYATMFTCTLSFMSCSVMSRKGMLDPAR